MSVFPSPRKSTPAEPLGRQRAGDAAWWSEEPRPALCRRGVFPHRECGVRRTAFCLVFLSDLSCSIWKETLSLGINFQADWKVYPYGCGWGFFPACSRRRFKTYSLSLARSQPGCHKYAQNFSNLFISPSLQLSLLIHCQDGIRTPNPALRLSEM